MIALLAVILAIVLVVSLWRLLDPKKAGSRGSVGPVTRAPAKPVRRSVLPPDDNPEFLRDLGDRLNERPTHGGPSGKGPQPRNAKPDEGETPTPV